MMVRPRKPRFYVRDYFWTHDSYFAAAMLTAMRWGSVIFRRSTRSACFGEIEWGFAGPGEVWLAHPPEALAGLETARDVALALVNLDADIDEDNVTSALNHIIVPRGDEWRKRRDGYCKGRLGRKNRVLETLEQEVQEFNRLYPGEGPFPFGRALQDYAPRTGLIKGLSGPSKETD